MSDDEISGALVEEKVKALRRDAEAGGYILNPDEDFVRKLARGICINEKRYGYRPAPAGLPSAGGRRTATSSARVTTAIPISRSSGPVTVHSMSHPQSRRGRRPSCPSRKGARRGPQENQWAPSPEESRDSPCRSGGAGCAGTSVRGRPRPSSARSARRRKTGSNASCEKAGSEVFWLFANLSGESSRSGGLLPLHPQCDAHRRPQKAPHRRFCWVSFPLIEKLVNSNNSVTLLLVGS